MSRSLVRQFLLALAVVLLYVMMQGMQEYTAHPRFAERAGGVAISLLLGIPNAIHFGLPIAVGVALSLLALEPGAFRRGMLLAGGVTLLLVGYDLFGSSLSKALDRRSMGTDALPQVPRFDDSTSSLGGAFAHLMGRVKVVDIQGMRTDTADSPGFAPIRDPRIIVQISAAMKYSQSLWMLLPLILGGVSVGVARWLTRIATFRTTRDERVLRLLLGWTLTILLSLLIPSLAMSNLYRYSSLHAPLWWIAAPYAIALFLAGMGWRSLRRLDSLAAA